MSHSAVDKKETLSRLCQHHTVTLLSDRGYGMLKTCVTHVFQKQLLFSFQFGEKAFVSLLGYV